MANGNIIDQLTGIEIGIGISMKIWCYRYKEIDRDVCLECRVLTVMEEGVH